MADGQKRSALQLINDHIKQLNDEMGKVDNKEEELIRQKELSLKSIHDKLKSLVEAINKCHVNAVEELEESYKQQLRTLNDAKERLKDRKRTAEVDLIVDHKPTQIPKINLDLTVDTSEALKAISAIQLKQANGITFVSTPYIKEEPTEESKSNTAAASAGGEVGCAASTHYPFPSSLLLSTLSAQKKNPRTSEGAPKMIRTTVRDFIKCIQCHKPRCVYSNQPLKKEDKEYWQRRKLQLKYRCGKQLHFPRNRLQLGVERVTRCSDELNWHYFIRERRFPPACYRCGADLTDRVSARPSIGENTDVVVHEVCHTCSQQGIQPRTKKKQKKSVPRQKGADDGGRRPRKSICDTDSSESN